MEIRWVLKSLIYCRLRLTHQVCFLNFRGMKLSPMAHARCKIIQVWEKQGFGRTGQIAWKSLKISHLALLPPWLNILVWKAVFLSLWNKTWACTNPKKILSPVPFHFHLPSFYLLWTRILICVLSFGDQHTHGLSDVLGSPEGVHDRKTASTQVCKTVWQSPPQTGVRLFIWNFGKCSFSQGITGLAYPFLYYVTKTKHEKTRWSFFYSVGQQLRRIKKWCFIIIMIKI